MALSLFLSFYLSLSRIITSTNHSTIQNKNASIPDSGWKGKGRRKGKEGEEGGGGRQGKKEIKRDGEI